MLVLTRKSEQKIIIGNHKRITVTILKVQGDQVSIGIEADRDTPIYREELLHEIEGGPEASTAEAQATRASRVPRPQSTDLAAVQK